MEHPRKEHWHVIRARVERLFCAEREFVECPIDSLDVVYLTCKHQEPVVQSFHRVAHAMPYRIGLGQPISFLFALTTMLVLSAAAAWARIISSGLHDPT